MIGQDFIIDFSKIIEVNPGALSDSFNIGQQATWDSLAYISTIALVDKHFGVVLDGDLLAQITYFSQLCDLIKEGAH